MLGRENLLSRDEVERLQGLRGMYGIASPAPICADDDAGGRAAWPDATCQVVQAPDRAAARGWCPTPADGVGSCRARPRARRTATGKFG